MTKVTATQLAHSLLSSSKRLTPQDAARLLAELRQVHRDELRAEMGLVTHPATTQPGEETHVVADDSDDPEHVDDCPGCDVATAARPVEETR